MEDFREKIFKKLEEGKICVFPTEESARAFATLYCRKTGRSILASQCISFDVFSSAFFSIPEGLEEASDVDISLFCQWFIDNRAEKLRYLYSPSYPEMKEHLPSYISKMLANINEAISGSFNLERNLFADLCLIKDSYQEFLDRNKLYQISYMDVDTSIDVSDYFLVSPEAFEKEIKFERQLANVELNHICAEDKKHQMNVYQTEKEEIRAAFSSIRKLLDSGAGLEEIAISVSGLERLTPYLKLEAKLFDIPLEIVPGLSVLSTLPGSLFSSLFEIYSGGYAIEDMKKLFLNPALPFKDKDAVRKFIMDAIRFSISSAQEPNEDRYAHIFSGEGFNYRFFRSDLDKLMSTKDPDRANFLLQRILLNLFGPERFKDNKEDDNVFGFIMNEFALLLSRYRKCISNEYLIDKPIFSTFISLLRDLKYVPKEKINGVRVYPLGQGALTPYTHHFLIALNEDESKREIKNASFLSEYERAGVNDEDITKALLNVYASINDNIYLSCSKKTYQGEVLPLVCLIDSQTLSTYTDDDQYMQEDSENRVSPSIYPLQKRGYDRALLSSLRDSNRPEMKGEKREGLIPLSYTSTTEYEKCPFRYALKYAFGFMNQQQYEIENYDALEIGTRLHSILERFDRNAPGAKAEDIEEYFNQEMDAWKNGTRIVYNGETGKEEKVDMEAGYSIPTDSMIAYIRRKYLKHLVSISRTIREESILVENGLEMVIRKGIDEIGVELNGKIDRVSRDKCNGSIIAYDYKSRAFDSKQLEEKKFQFDIYNLLLQKELGEEISSGSFVSLRDEKRQGWENSEMRESNALKRLLNAANGIREGVWNKTENEDECIGCDYKGICRRRMAIK